MTETLAVPLPRRAAPAGIDFDALYRANRDDLYAYVATLLRDRATAEDVTASAFERAFRRQHSFRSRRGTPRAWLFGIARNAALDELRRRRRVGPMPEDPFRSAPGSTTVEEAADQTLRRDVVRRALAELSPRERDLVALKFFAGLSNLELARVLGISESSAGTRLHRTVAKLRKACHEAA
jgi:RNA polymerase sigma-70 factor, ECF subfamily